MITITRCLARTLRTVFRKAERSSNRLQPPAVVFETGSDGLRVQYRGDQVVVEYLRAGDHEPETVAVPLAALSEFAGNDEADVRLQLAGKTVITEWQDSAIPQRRTYDVTKPVAMAKRPAEMVPISGVSVLAALDAAACCTANDRMRYALDCIQLRRNDVVGTDGKQALIAGGLVFPWAEPLLAPSTRLFGCKELQGNGPVTAGRTDSHVVFAVGPWTVWLPIEKDVRFPDVDAIMPNIKAAKTQIRFASEDLDFLAHALPKLPSSNEDNGAVVLDCNGTVTIRANDSAGGRATELVLSGSKSTGKPLRLVTDRRYFMTAAALGLADLYLTGKQSAVIAAGAGFRYVWMPLTDNVPIARGADCIRIESSSYAAASAEPRPKVPKQTKGTNMPRTQSNATAEPSPEISTKSDPAVDLVQQAEELKQTLRDAVAQVNDLIAQVKQHRKTAKVVQSTLSALRQLDPVA